MAREAHAIRRVSGGKLPAQIAVIQADCERISRAGSRVMFRTVATRAVLYTGKIRSRRFLPTRVLDTTDISSLWDALQAFAADGTLTWVFSWNARDLAAQLGLWDRFIRGDVSLSGEDHMDPTTAEGTKPGKWKGYVVMEAPPTVIQFRFKGGSGHVRWVDVANYGVDSAWEILRATGMDGAAASMLPSGPIPAEPPAIALAPAVYKFAHSLYDTVARFQFGSFQATAASQAQHAFRHRFLDYPMDVHADNAVLALERDALYSGRCECGIIGIVHDRDIPIVRDTNMDEVIREISADGPIYQLDVNSLYPAVARDAMIPSKLTGVHADVPPEMLLGMVSSVACVARVLVETDEPIVPVRVNTKELGKGSYIDRGYDSDPRDVDKGVIWPVGRFWTTLAGPELMLAFHEANIVKCSVVATYESHPHFRRWVDELYAWRNQCRQEGDSIGAKVCKRILNSLFGKFAQRNKRWVDVDDALSTDPFAQWWRRNAETGLPEQWRSFAWHVQRLTDLGEHAESMPIITAWITSLARVRLWEMIQAANEHNVYYYDTDSIWTNREGLGKLQRADMVHQTKLGKLKLEKAYDVVQYYGIKHYVADGHVVCAGLPADSRLTADGRAEIRSRPPLSSYLWKREAPQADEVQMTIPVLRPYLHGKIEADGRTGPLRLRDPDDSIYSLWQKENA